MCGARIIGLLYSTSRIIDLLYRTPRIIDLSSSCQAVHEIAILASSILDWFRPIVVRVVATLTMSLGHDATQLVLQGPV